MQIENFKLTNKTALITGGSRGIGFGIASVFIDLEATVIITGRNEASLIDACEKLGPNTHYMVNDIDEFNSHEKLVADIMAKYGNIDILVNNAGKHSKKDSLKISNNEFQEVLNTNLTGVFSLSKACLKHMIENKSGSIINISSMSAIYGLPEVAAYSSSKTGLLGLTRTLASEYSESGVRVNAIAPGFIESKMFLDIMAKDPEREKRILSRTPMKRFGDKQELSGATLLLASDAGSFVTGTEILVDGGYAAMTI
jgi:NAD(P)-dependent dehydrogenase (short-subunit alcohol dehydrogenase family)